MSYSEFTLEVALERFQLEIVEADLFSTVPPLPVSPILEEVLRENVPLALSIHSELARSMFIVAPILVELRKLKKHQISFFPGADLNVDPARGLTGACDYVISRSPQQLFLTTPVLVIVEAKRDSIRDGLGQCIAEMVAARLFNEQQGKPVEPMYGMVTTGSNWQPLQLLGQTVTRDGHEYYLDGLGKILGILDRMTN